MTGPRDAHGLTAASDWPRGIRSGSIVPRSVPEAFAVAFTLAVDDGLGVRRRLERRSVPPGTVTARELYIAGARRLQMGRDAFAETYWGSRWLRWDELDRALADSVLGPVMRQHLSPGGTCDLQKMLLWYASASSLSGHATRAVLHSEPVPSNPSAGRARLGKVGQLKDEVPPRVRPAGVRDAVRMALQDGRPRRSAAIKVLAAESFYGTPLDDDEATAVSSALSHLVARNEIERLPDGRYRATEHLKEPKKQP